MRYIIKMTCRENGLNHYLGVQNDRIALKVYTKDAITFPTIKQAKMWFDLNHNKKIHERFEIEFISI